MVEFLFASPTKTFTTFMAWHGISRNSYGVSVSKSIFLVGLNMPMLPACHVYHQLEGISVPEEIQYTFYVIEFNSIA